ncbi:uncharacterized protein LOC114811156 [Ornithorhynchus anatinus]|uniref:uncharacterized protein LOC114811156 n=1 Tax=Ornithorhynchus anatinus TaxID=9258 RepID=UPI0019D45B36|nr:uncharacterized protein LOC114811156 [Ornithorhynchus anatinus]
MDPDWVAPWATQETERWGMFNSWFVTSPGPTWRSWLSCSLGASSDPNLPTEKKHYQEWYISDTPDRDRSSPGSIDSGGVQGGGRTRRRRSRSPPQLDSCRGSAGSRRSSGSKVGSGQRASGEMSVDGPSSSSNGDALGRDDRVPDGHKLGPVSDKPGDTVWGYPWDWGQRDGSADGLSVDGPAFGYLNNCGGCGELIKKGFLEEEEEEGFQESLRMEEMCKEKAKEQTFGDDTLRPENASVNPSVCKQAGSSIASFKRLDPYEVPCDIIHWGK